MVTREESGWYTDFDARELLCFVSRDDLLEGVFNYLTCRMASPNNCQDVFDKAIKDAEERREEWKKKRSGVI